MENSRKYNLTEGSIISKILLISLPVMATQFVQMAYNLTDMFWLGRLSSDAVAASGSAGMYMWLAMGPMMIARMGAQIGVSQSTGMGNTEAAHRFSKNALFIAILVGVIFGGAMVVFNGPLIGFFNIQESHVARDASGYLAIIGLGVPLTYMSAAVAGIFNGAGNSRLPFVINTIGLVANMILDPVMIFTFDWGIIGAAIATITGQAIVCVLSLLALKFARSRPFDKFKLLVKPSREPVRKIIKWGIPLCVESMLFCFLSMIISRFVSEWGADVIAAHKVGNQIDSMSWLISGGFAMALTTYTGQNFGAGKWSRIHRGFKVSALIMIGWGIVVTAVCYFGARPLATIFLDDPDVIAVCTRLLRIFALSSIAYCLEVIAAGAFRGVGKTLPPSLAATTVNAIRIPAIYLMSQSALGLDGIWIGVTLFSVIRSLAILIWYLLYARKQPKEDVAVAEGISA